MSPLYVDSSHIILGDLLFSNNKHSFIKNPFSAKPSEPDCSVSACYDCKRDAPNPKLNALDTGRYFALINFSRQ